MPQAPQCRLAKWSDTAAMAEVAAKAFDQNDLSGRYMHPHRHQFPNDFVTFWRQEIRAHFFEPAVCLLVTTSTAPAKTEVCEDGDGNRGRGGGGDDGGDMKESFVVGLAMWKRQGAIRRPFSSWINVLLHHIILLTTRISRRIWPNRAADPCNINCLSDATPFFAHHWSGPRVETWFLEMLGVQPEFQGYGYGRALVQWGKDRAREERVCASLTSAEEKEGFYAKMGFEEVGRANVGPLEGVLGGAIMFCDEPYFIETWLADTPSTPAIEAGYRDFSQLYLVPTCLTSPALIYGLIWESFQVVMITLLLLGLGVIYLIWSLLAMEINYRRASSMGIPLLRLPVDPLNLIWLILEPPLWRLLDHLPFSWGSFGHYSRRGWQFHDKAESHLQYGPIWAVVTPCDIYVYVADPDAIRDIFHRRGDFLRPTKMYKMLEVYGPSISTVSWTDWPRHRKVLAAPFNENIMCHVWDESLSQAEEMLQSWIRCAENGTLSVVKDTRTLSLNVLAATGFRRPSKFRSSSEPTSDEAQIYRDALQTVLDNAIFLMLVPPRLLLLPLLPRSWARIGKAAADFRIYMLHMLSEETKLLNQGGKGTGSLMTSLVRALDNRPREETFMKDNAAPSPLRGLTADEILGNIFTINFAGHDTTANTLAFSMLLLAAHPECQEWVAEELQECTKELDSGDWDYCVLFPKLKRCRAVLLETLRLYPAIVALPKWSNQHPQQLYIGEKRLIIPPRTGVIPSLLAMQTHPKYWQDPLAWQPSRWILRCLAPGFSNANIDSAVRPHQEEIFVPAQSAYFPWSDGPQNCPGAKFAQVEFVAVLACLLREHRVGIVPELDESFEKARQRVMAVTEDCDLKLLLRMRNADKIRLMWTRVENERQIT